MGWKLLPPTTEEQSREFSRLRQKARFLVDESLGHAVAEVLREDGWNAVYRSEEHTSELQSRPHLVCRLLLEKKNAPVLRPQHWTQAGGDATAAPTWPVAATGTEQSFAEQSLQPAPKMSMETQDGSSVEAQA